MSFRRAVILAALATLALTACGKSSSTTSNTTASTDAGSAPPTTAAVAPPGTIPAADRSLAGRIGTEPTIKVPSGPAPSGLETADLILGTGPATGTGSSVTIQYVGASYSTGKVFDASWSRNQTLPFTLGQGEVIPGMDQGVAGMKVGGRREIVIPPALAYGATPPAGSGIAVNATLIFIVDLVSIG